MFDKRVMILLIFSCCAGLILGFVYQKTKTKIEENEKIKKISLLKEIFPEMNNVKEINGKYLMYTNGNEIGTVIPRSVYGYSGWINMLVGFYRDGKISNVRIISHKETPGLGAKIVRHDFLTQFSGKTIDEIKLKKDGGKIDAITGATISSRAVIKGIESAHTEYLLR